MTPTATSDSALAAFAELRKPWPNIRTFLFVGSRFETMTHVLWDGKRAKVVKSKDGGDGTVNLQGAMVDARQIRLTDKNHLSLIKSDEARLALQDLFDADGLLAMSTETIVTLTPAKLFVDQHEPVEILIGIDGPGLELKGEFYLERAQVLRGGENETLDESAFAGRAQRMRTIDRL